tara:strand:- start:911 stop:2038 length:1128 start_codon:yes stop_codon:yes gene_type:complete
MGAGDSKTHMIQDAAEAYIVYRLQDLAVKNNTALTDSAEDKKKIFNIYCYDRGIVSDFDKSVYKANIDAIVDGFYSDLINQYPNRKFDFVDVEKEFRDKKWKGDFIIKFDGVDDYVSFSLKNYKKGFNRIQLCSGTWHSFLNNFLFKSAGVGTFIDPYSGQIFQGCDYEHRDSLVEKLGYSTLTDSYQFFDDVNTTIKEFYAYGEKANQWSNVSTQWKHDCKEYGLEAANKVIDALKGVDNSQVKSRIIQMAGLTDAEEILLVGKEKYLCSLFNKKYRDILKRINSEECVVEYATKRKSIIFTLRDDDGIVVTVEVPFTLQKNGAWYLPKQRYSGTHYHEKEKVDLIYGQRRPKKSKEIATSINTYLNLKKAGVY